MLSAALFTLNAQADEMKPEERDEPADWLFAALKGSSMYCVPLIHHDRRLNA